MLRFYLTILISHHHSGEINFLLNSVCFPNTQEQRPSTTCCQCTFNPWEISCLFCKLTITITTVHYPDQSLSSSPLSINFLERFILRWLAQDVPQKWFPQLPLTDLSPIPGSFGPLRSLWRASKPNSGHLWGRFWPCLSILMPFWPFCANKGKYTPFSSLKRSR